MKRFFITAFLFTSLLSCGKTLQEEADAFLKSYNQEYQAVYYEASKAQWKALTDINALNDSLSVVANKKYAAFAGSKDIIQKVRFFREHRSELNDITIRQLDKIWLDASHQPGTMPDVVDQLIKANTEATSALYSYQFTVNGKPYSANDIDRALRNSSDLKEREAVWTASKEVGKIERDHLARLQELRNKVAREMKYSSFFDLEAHDYGMSSDEVIQLMDQFSEDLKPLYRELHTYIRYELAKKYNQPVPEYLPAHWLPNRWAQNWPGLVPGLQGEGDIPGKSKEWVVEQAEKFYMSMGFEKLNDNFYKNSDLYPADAASGRKKNTHASAWHLNLDQDYRSLMSVEPNMEWFKTTHHELGHIYYYIAYTNPEVPLTLRAGANRAYHEAMGDLMAVAASQEAYLASLGLFDKTKTPDAIKLLLNSALSNSSIVFLPFAAGTMTHFEYELYEKNLPKEEFNKTWWALAKKYQGIVPPKERGAEYCDAATKTHIIDDPAQYYDYAISCVLKFQMHDHIAKQILKQDPANCNYYGSKEAGEFIRSIMRPGASKDWRQVLKEKTGQDLSAKAMLDYYGPLYDWLLQQNKGRKKAEF